MHALPFSAQRSPTSTSLCILENHTRGVDRCTGLTEKSMFFLSWLTARGSGMGSACLITDTDSPAKTRGERWTTRAPSPASAHPCAKPASHTPQHSRAALCHQTIQTSTVGMSNPTRHTGKPQALCSAGRIPKHWTHLTYAVTLRSWEGTSIISVLLSHPFPTPRKHLSRHWFQNLPPGGQQEEAASAPRGPDAPVRMDWSTRRVVERISMILMSAGTLSPTARTGAEQLRQAAPNTPGMGEQIPN